MIYTDIAGRYFDWLYERVCGDWEPRGLSFHRLLAFLYNQNFTRLVSWMGLAQRTASTCDTGLLRRKISCIRTFRTLSPVFRAACLR